ncbi:MAG: amidohydrolase, partial [FCB group bacterium]|nr:amidohydrolase [FCB group bacterium]
MKGQTILALFIGSVMSVLMAEKGTTLFTDCHVFGYPEANAILSENGTITVIGSATDFSAEDTVSLKGGYLYPGFTDAHLHLTGLGWSLEVLDLVGTKSAEEIVALVSEATTRTGKRRWIQGRGWDQNDWAIPEYPTKNLLDRVAPDVPVCLRRIDGHAVWVNSRALEIAGITADFADPDGGKILRDEHGAPTGILIDNAIALVVSHIPPDTKEDKRRYVLRATALLNSLGITAVHDAGTDAETIAVLKELTAENALPLRVYAMLNNQPEDYQVFLESGPETGNPFLKVRAVKLYLDGALGSRGAALLAPYTDDPLNYGLILTDSSVIARQVQRFNTAGFQVCVHCIGDRANRIALDIFENLRRVIPGDHRNRIEHAQIVHRRDIPRFAILNVIPSMQATHCTSDMYWADERLGPARLEEAYPWQSLVRSGSIIA